MFWVNWTSKIKKDNSEKSTRKGTILFINKKIWNTNHWKTNGKTNGFQNFTISEGRKCYNSMNGILSHYQIRCGIYLGLGRFSKGIIPYACIGCIYSMDLKWDTYILPQNHSRYYSVKNWKYYPILWKHNYWVVMYFIKKGIDEE